MDIHRTVNRRAGGESPHILAFLSNTSVLGVAGIPRPNCAKSFHRVPKVHNTIRHSYLRPHMHPYGYMCSYCNHRLGAIKCRFGNVPAGAIVI